MPDLQKTGAPVRERGEWHKLGQLRYDLVSLKAMRQLASVYTIGRRNMLSEIGGSGRGLYPARSEQFYR